MNLWPYDSDLMPAGPLGEHELDAARIAALADRAVLAVAAVAAVLVMTGVIR